MAYQIINRTSKVVPTTNTPTAQKFWMPVLTYQPASTSNPHQYQRNGVPIMRIIVNDAKKISLLMSVHVSHDLGTISLAARKIVVKSMKVRVSPQAGWPNPATDEVT